MFHIRFHEEKLIQYPFQANGLWFRILFISKQCWVFLVNAKINHQKLQNEGLRYFWCTYRRGNIWFFSCQLAFAVYVYCFEGLQGPAWAHTYTLLIYSPFCGTTRREPFLLGYETPLKWTLFRKQQHVEGDYCMSKNTCNCYCPTLCILTKRTYTSKYVLQTCLGLTIADT